MVLEKAKYNQRINRKINKAATGQRNNQLKVGLEMVLVLDKMDEILTELKKLNSR